jgi:hypothetical protein
MKIIVTEQILQMNPELGSLGYMVGDEITVSLEFTPLEDEEPDTENLEDPPTGGGGTGGERPPTGPRRP